MNHDPIRIFYLIAFVAMVWWFLLAGVARFKRSKSGALLKLGLGAGAIIASFLPIGGLPLWQTAFGVWANPSLPLLGLVCAGLGQRLFGITWLQPADRRATWLFGAVAGTVIYLHTMVFGGMDLYYWGWVRPVSVGGLALTAIVFLAFGSRVGVLLLAALAAYALGVLESPNCWDYVVDPFYWLAGLGVALRETIRRGRKLHRWRATPRDGQSNHEIRT
jgi:hypothetical protein